MPMLLGRIIFYSNEYFKENISSSDISGTVNSTLVLYSNQSTTTNEDEQFDVLLWLNVTWLSSHQRVIAYSGLLALVILVNVCFSHPYFFRQFRYGMHIRVAVTRLIFEKAMRVSTTSVQQNTVGKIVNLISNDSNRFDIAYIYVGFVYMSLLETAVGMYTF